MEEPTYRSRWAAILEVTKIACEIMDDEQGKVFVEKIQELPEFKRQVMDME